MRIEALAIQGFRAFTKDTVIRFPKGNGLYAVRGRNEANPELGPNGVGKSTIWDALSWVFYGASTRKLKTKQLDNWSGSHPCSVVCDFVLNKKAYSVTRTYTSPITLTIQEGRNEPKNIAQDKLTDLLGMDHATFLATVVHPQLGESFLSLGKAEKLERFSRVLELDQWLDHSDAAKRLAVELEGDAEAENLALTRVEGGREAKARELERARDLAATFEDQRAREVRKIERVVADGKHSLEGVEAALARATENVDEIGDWIDTCERALAKLERRRLAAQKEAAEAGAELSESDMVLGHLTHSIHGIANLRDIECPACRQAVSTEHVEETLAALTKQAEELQEKTRPAREAHNRATRAQLQIDREQAERRQSLATKRRTYDKAQTDVRRAERQVEQERASLQRAIDRLDEWRTKDNPYTAQVETITKELAGQRGKARKLRRSLEALQSEAALYRELQKAFKDVRLSVSRSAMQEFAVVMMSALDQLGLRGWEVRCDIEKPTGRSGARGFMVLIRSPESPDWVPLEVWCGGETQRLFVAGDVAFSELVCGSTGASPSVEVWDEPTRGLSAEGVEDLLRFLADRARRRDRAVFLVDHNKHESAQYTGEYEVVRTPVSVNVLSSVDSEQR